MTVFPAAKVPVSARFAKFRTHWSALKSTRRRLDLRLSVACNNIKAPHAGWGLTHSDTEALQHVFCFERGKKISGTRTTLGIRASATTLDLAHDFCKYGS